MTMPSRPVPDTTARLPQGHQATRLGRRAALGGLAAGLLAMLAGSSRDPWRLARPLDGSFVQPWRDDLALSGTQWAERVADARQLGCRHLVLQWTRHGTDYALDADLIIRLMDFVLAAGCRLEVGLPYEADYWHVLEERASRGRLALLEAAAHACEAFMAAAPFAGHPAFAGWYIPYEIDQASWVRTQDVAALAFFLQRLKAASGSQPLSISCFHSRNDPSRSLLDLWQALPAMLDLRLLVQDGVGVFGLDNYRLLAPVFAHLRARGRPFDVVVEVFDQKANDPLEPGAFVADAARFTRIAAQLELAAASGADRLIAFALHPYMTGPAPGAAHLRAAYERAMILSQ
ncbi:MAG: DUF4434 domain-containing protein [Pseudomonadota bacterium]